MISSLTNLSLCTHPWVIEKESNGSLPFLDMLVERSGNAFSTSVFQKPTFSGPYIVFLWSLLKSWKEVLCKIKGILLDSDYPEDILVWLFMHRISIFNSSPMQSPDKCPIYLKLPWENKSSQSLVDQIKSYISECYLATKMWVVFSASCVLPSFQKDKRCPFSNGSVVYYLSVHAMLTVGRTSQCLVTRINQY